MDKNKRNALQRARLSSGLTQEALAERSGYSADSVRAWEFGARMASLEALGILGEVLDAPWLPGVYLREQSTALNDLLPDFEVDRPLAEAAAEYVSCILSWWTAGWTVRCYGWWRMDKSTRWSCRCSRP